MLWVPLRRSKAELAAAQPGVLGVNGLTAGVLVLAKEWQLITAVKPCLDALMENRFFLLRPVYEVILKGVGEI